MQDAKTSKLYETWWVDTTVNHWRHRRLMSPVLEVLVDLKGFRWLTIGMAQAWMHGAEPRFSRMAICAHRYQPLSLNHNGTEGRWVKACVLI